MTSVFANAIQFLDTIGLYDVILPFILSFVIMYAILEKTKILGTFTVDKVEYTKQNLNSMVAFCAAFFVIASSSLVSIINEAVGKIVILVMLSIFYLLLIGTFYSKGEEVFLEKGPWRTGFMIATLIGIILIFASSIPTGTGDQTWLDWVYDQVVNNATSPVVSSIILVIIVLVVMFFVVSEPKSSKNGGSKE
ncbi:MAG: hypothetical protein ACMXYA_02840 [Candidatus Woesearchaeota archaeon]